MSNRDPFEERLARTPFRPAPAALRAQVFQAFYRVEGADLAAITWRTRITGWLWPNPLAWGTLGLAWLAVLSLNLASLATLDSTASRPEPSRISPAWTTVLLEQRALFQSLLEDPVAPAFPPRNEPGAQIGLPEKTARFLA